MLSECVMHMKCCHPDFCGIFSILAPSPSGLILSVQRLQLNKPLLGSSKSRSLFSVLFRNLVKMLCFYFFIFVSIFGMFWIVKKELRKQERVLDSPSYVDTRQTIRLFKTMSLSIHNSYQQECSVSDSALDRSEKQRIVQIFQRNDIVEPWGWQIHHVFDESFYTGAAYMQLKIKFSVD